MIAVSITSILQTLDTNTNTLGVEINLFFSSNNTLFNRPTKVVKNFEENNFESQFIFLLFQINFFVILCLTRGSSQSTTVEKSDAETPNSRLDYCLSVF